MQLLQEIVNEATASETDVPRLLRLCLRLANQLGVGALRDWARHELNGYPPEKEVPTYRVMRGLARGEFVGPHRTFHGTFDISFRCLPKELQEKCAVAQMREPVAHIADLISSGGGGPMVRKWPEAAARLYAIKGFVRGTQCLSAWTMFSRSDFVAALDQIKSRVLDFAMEIEREFGPGNVNTANPAPGPEAERVTQIFNTTIQGNVQNFSAGGGSVTQSAVQNVRAGDWDSLANALRSMGLQADDVADLRRAIDADPAPTGQGLGGSVRDWLNRMAVKASEGLAGVGIEVVGGLLTQAVLIYSGMGDN